MQTWRKSRKILMGKLGQRQQKWLNLTIFWSKIASEWYKTVAKHWKYHLKSVYYEIYQYFIGKHHGLCNFRWKLGLACIPKITQKSCFQRKNRDNRFKTMKNGFYTQFHPWENVPAQFSGFFRCQLAKFLEKA